MEEKVEQLTRQTWRAGKKGRMRKRVNRYGGQTAANPALLEAAKRTYFPNQRKCSSLKKDGTPCGMIAYRGMTVCGAHGGQMALAKQKRLQSSGRSAAYKALKTETVGAPPFDLTQTKAYRKANLITRQRLISVCDAKLKPRSRN